MFGLNIKSKLLFFLLNIMAAQSFCPLFMNSVFNYFTSGIKFKLTVQCMRNKKQTKKNNLVLAKFFYQREKDCVFT